MEFRMWWFALLELIKKFDWHLEIGDLKITILGIIEKSNLIYKKLVVRLNRKHQRFIVKMIRISVVWLNFGSLCVTQK